MLKGNDACALIFIFQYFLLKLFAPNLEEEVDWILELGPAKRKALFNQSIILTVVLGHHYHTDEEYNLSMIMLKMFPTIPKAAMRGMVSLYTNIITSSWERKEL